MAHSSDNHVCAAVGWRVGSTAATGLLALRGKEGTEARWNLTAERACVLTAWRRRRRRRRRRGSVRVDSGIRGTLQNAALTIPTLAAEHPDVAVLAPAATPRVLHLPVLHAGVHTVAHSRNTMIKLSAAVALQHTRLVGLKGRLVGLDRNGHGLFVQRGHQSRLTVLDVRVRRHSALWDHHITAVRVAASVPRSVRVARLATQGNTLGKLERVVDQTTIASTVLLRAVHKLLF